MANSVGLGAAVLMLGIVAVNGFMAGVLHLASRGWSPGDAVAALAETPLGDLVFRVIVAAVVYGGPLLAIALIGRLLQ